MSNNSQLSSWPIFLHSLYTKFDPSQFDDPEGVLFKLTQTSFVPDYQCQFEALSNRVISLPHHFLLFCFTSGLKPHICREVQVLQPFILIHAIDLAKLQEDKFSKIHKFQRTNNTINSYSSFQKLILTLGYIISAIITKTTKQCYSEEVVTIRTTRNTRKRPLLHMR